MAQHSRARWRWRSPEGIALLVFLAIIAFFLIAEHWAHLLGTSPLLLFLGFCILIHFFMHAGHGGHSSHRGPGDPGKNPDDPRSPD